MSIKKDKIIRKALNVLQTAGSVGVRYTALIDAIRKALPKEKINTIHGTIWNLDKKLPDKIIKPARGLWKLKIYGFETEVKREEAIKVTKSAKEEDFYQPFAEYLCHELEECTKAIPLGGNKFGSKWGTPDVIGALIPKQSDVIRQLEIVSAEIKIDTSGQAVITAFGQASAYKLFSHKVYLVLPKTIIDEDKSRVESLCLISGIGLILLDLANKNKFEIKVRAIKHEPDTFYANENMKSIESELFKF